MPVEAWNQVCLSIKNSDFRGNRASLALFFNRFVPGTFVTDRVRPFSPYTAVVCCVVGAKITNRRRRKRLVTETADAGGRTLPTRCVDLSPPSPAFGSRWFTTTCPAAPRRFRSRGTVVAHVSSPMIYDDDRRGTFFARPGRPAAATTISVCVTRVASQRRMP